MNLAPTLSLDEAEFIITVFESVDEAFVPETRAIAQGIIEHLRDLIQFAEWTDNA